MNNCSYEYYIIYKSDVNRLIEFFMKVVKRLDGLKFKRFSVYLYSKKDGFI